MFKYATAREAAIWRHSPEVECVRRSRFSRLYLVTFVGRA